MSQPVDYFKQISLKQDIHGVTNRFHHITLAGATETDIQHQIQHQKKETFDNNTCVSCHTTIKNTKSISIISTLNTWSLVYPQNIPNEGTTGSILTHLWHQLNGLCVFMILVTALWFEDETHKLIFLKCSTCRRQKTLCVRQDGTPMPTTLNLNENKKHTLRLVSVNDCIALCIKPQPKPEFATRSTCCRVMRRSCGQLSLFGSSSPRPPYPPVCFSLVWQGGLFKNPGLSTVIKNKACLFWSVEVWSRVEYSSRVLFSPSNICHTKTLVIFLRNSPSGIQTIAKN